MKLKVHRFLNRHRWTGRYEAHLWDKGCWNPTQRKKGKQVYLGECLVHPVDCLPFHYFLSFSWVFVLYIFDISENIGYEQALMMKKNLPQELMIWQHSNTGESQPSLISL